MDLWAQAATTVLTALVIGWCLSLSNRDPKITDGAIVLRYPLAMRWLLWLGAAFLLVALGVLVLELLGAAPATRTIRTAWIAFPILVPIIVFGLCEPRVRYQIDAEGIRGRTAFRGHRAIAWADLATVRWSRISYWYVLASRTGEKVRVCRYLQGHAALVAALQTKVPEKVWRKAVDAANGTGS